MGNGRLPDLPRRAPRKATFGLLSAFLVLAFAVVAGCQRHAEPVQLAGKTMGTTYHVTLAGGATIDADDLQAAIDRRLAEINQSMSTYIDDSELNQVNRAPVDQWVAISDELHDVLLLAMQVGWLSSGAFDVTVGPLVDLWGFGPGGYREDVPAAAELAAARKMVGFQNLELDVGEPRLRKTQPLRLDLSAIAKGYGVDEIAELLQQRGLNDFLVEIGGELRLSGQSPRGTPWRVAVEKPDGLPGQVQQAMLVTDAAVATSGDYRNYFEAQGRRFSHTIDPVAGTPVEHNLASVTVIADTAAYADALATALEVMGHEGALALAEQQGLAVYLIVRAGDGFEVYMSDAFKPYLESGAS